MPGWCGSGLTFLKSIGVGFFPRTGLELNGGGAGASFGGILPFWAILGPLGHFGQGGPWRTPDSQWGILLP